MGDDRIVVKHKMEKLTHCVFAENLISYTHSVINNGVKNMDVLKKEIVDRRQKIKELRESTGMNRKEFCEYFQIPYRTVTEWERDNRHAPDYVLRLLEYYIVMEHLDKNR